MKTAIKDLDVKFFQNIPGIGPKSAKKILLELKDSIKQDDLVKLAIDDKLLKKITTTLK
jgi:Holliday junction DNA helicase RuvA